MGERTPGQLPSMVSVAVGVAVFLGIIVLAVSMILLRQRTITSVRPANHDVQCLVVSVERYYADLGSYPPDDIVPIGGSAENAFSESLVHYLGQVQRQHGRAVGPYMEFSEDRLTDSDTDGFMEFRDPWGGVYVYALRTPAPGAIKSKTPPRFFDIASPGPDGLLGGEMVPGKGYVPATTPEGKAAEADNVTSW